MNLVTESGLKMRSVSRGYYEDCWAACSLSHLVWLYPVHVLDAQVGYSSSNPKSNSTPDRCRFLSGCITRS
jgi:hypothetical protein